MSPARTCGALVASCLMIAACAVPEEQPSTRSTVIVNAQLADGTGPALRAANVRIVGDRIERIGGFEPQSNDTVIDRATFAEPTLMPTGIEKVFVNGEIVWSEGKATGARPGRVLPK